MPSQDTVLTSADFDACNWQAAIAASEEKSYWAYSLLLLAKAREAEAAGDRKAQEVFRLLGRAASLMLEPDSKDEPLVPQLVTSHGRSAAITDFTDNDLDLLKGLLPDIADAEMRARVGDLLWVAKRDFRSAQVAVTAYLDSARTLEHPSDWSEGAERLERALRIAAMLDSRARKPVYYPQVVAAIEDILARYNGEDPSFLSARMMELLLEHGEGDARHHAALAEKAGGRAEDEAAWYRAREYWGLSARWWARAGDTEAERAARLRAAETYVAEAEQVLPRPSQGFIAAAHHLQCAIEAYRRVGGTTARVEELHRKLLEYQRESLRELKTVSASYDVTSIAEKALAQVREKSLPDALVALALYGSLSRVSFLRAQVEAQARHGSPQNWVNTTLLEDEGRNVGRRPALLLDDAAERGSAIRAAMFEEAKRHQFAHAVAVVEPMCRQVMFDHAVNVTDLLPFVSNNPFVPPGREMIFARGFCAGLTGDLLGAAALLIPQVENSLRHVLAQHDVITSKLDANGIQDDYDLNALFAQFATQLTELFGEDLVFDLEGLLIRRNGSNLRNRFAHGLLAHDDFYSAGVLYFWWLTLRICCLQVIPQRVLDGQAPSSPGSTEETDVTERAEGENE